jgi:BirA family transcriptional regulator, biotin operon repressor / biotin---[acetyl-CoA-carboxylase] ligase
MYDLAALENALAGTVYAGNLRFLPVTASTNNDARAAARDGARHGTVIFADEQTAGRGRGDHVWHSAPGLGLYVSAILRLRLPATHMQWLPLAGGLAAAEAIRVASGLAVDLRWPNDLLLGPRKTGGILAEAQTDAGVLSFAVMGIGINVHQRSFDPNLATPATSLDLESGRTIDRQQLLIALLESLDHEARALLGPGAEETIRARLERNSTWLRGREVEVHGPQACIGVTAGLDEHGFLLVRTPEGLVRVQTGGIRAAGARIPAY